MATTKPKHRHVKSYPIPSEKISSVVVTPQMASSWIELTHENQRFVNWDRVNIMVEDMLHEKWTESTDAIGFDIRGKLVNGQHRLHALVLANTSIRMDVKTNLPENSIHNIDTGKRRTPTDLTKISGITKYPKQKAEIANLINTIFTGNMVASHESRLTIIHDYNSEIETVVEAMGTTRQHKITSAPVMTALTFLCKKHKEIVLRFISELRSGANLSETSPVLALRNRLFSGKSIASSHTMRVETFLRVVSSFHAYTYNKHRLRSGIGLNAFLKYAHEQNYDTDAVYQIWGPRFEPENFMTNRKEA